MTDPAKDPRIVLAALARSHPVLELGTLDVCFLAALIFASRGRCNFRAFNEEKLSEVFEQVCARYSSRARKTRSGARHTRSSVCATKSCSRASMVPACCAPASLR